jgi:hypothetical protein
MPRKRSRLTAVAVKMASGTAAPSCRKALSATAWGWARKKASAAAGSRGEGKWPPPVRMAVATRPPTKSAV